jgi:hypothetical protein
MSSLSNKHQSNRDTKGEKQQDGHIRQLLLQACNERLSGLTDKEQAQHVDAGEQQIARLKHAVVVLRWAALLLQHTTAALARLSPYMQASGAGATPVIYIGCLACPQKSSRAVADNVLPLSCRWLARDLYDRFLRISTTCPAREWHQAASST